MNEIKPIAEKVADNNYVPIARQFFSYDWIFDKWWEKVIVGGSFLWAVISIIMYVRSIL